MGLVRGRSGWGTHVREDVHHGLGGKVLEVVSVLREGLEQLDTSQHHFGVLRHGRGREGERLPPERNATN